MSLFFRFSKFSLSDMSIPDEFCLLINILFGNGISFFSLLTLIYGFSANHSELVSGSSSLFMNELFAPFSSNLLTKYGNKSL